MRKSNNKAETSSNQKKTVVEDEYDSYTDEESEEVTVESLEQSLIQTIQEMAVYVGSITKDLEDKEKEYLNSVDADIDDAIENGEEPPERPAAIWEDSTFKIDFVKKMLLTFFSKKVGRLMKYYIIFLFPMKKWILKRKEVFFLKANIFPGAPNEYIQFFRNLWQIEGTMTDEERNTIWDFWDAQIDIVERWEKLTGWVINPNEKLNIPNFDYDKAIEEAGLDDSDE